MTTKCIRIVAVAVLAGFVSACSHTAPTYSLSANNIDEIKQLVGSNSIKLGVDNFSAKENANKKSISCRAAGPVEAPDNKTFHQYIQSAIIDELRIAGVYDAASKVKLYGDLDFIDFSSNIGAGKWTLNMTFAGNGVEPFSIQSEYSFSTNWIADKACQQVAQALVPATQGLIKKLIAHPSFKKLITPGAAVSK